MSIKSPALNGVRISSCKVILTSGGEVLHGLKSSDRNFKGFGEAYFSTVNPGVIKAWKRHKRMTMNILVPTGCIVFVLYDDRIDSTTKNQFMNVVLSRDNYCCLTVPPMVWMGFQCLGDVAGILLNIASIPHDPKEVDRQSVEEIPYDWE